MVNRSSPADVGSRLDRLFYPALLLLIIIAPSQLSYAVHPHEGPFITPADVLLGLIFVLWLLGVAASRSWGKLWRAPEAAWAFLLVAILSMTIAADIKLAAREILQFGLYFIVAYLLVVDTLRRRQQLRTVVAALTAVTGVVVLWGLVDYIIEPDAMDVAASFGNRNVYSAYLVMVLPLLYGLAIYASNRLGKLALFVVVGIGAVTMLSGPLFWCLVAVLLVMSIYHSKYTAFYYVVVAGLILAIMPTALPRNYDAAITELGNIYESGEVYKVLRPRALADEEELRIVKKRWLEWQPALMMLARNPMLGVGIGNYQLRIGEALYYGELPNVKKSEPDTNNLYLVVAGSTGLAGLVCWIALFGRFVRWAEKMWIWAEDRFEEGLAAGLAGSLAGIIIGNLFTSLSVRGTAIIMVLILALIELTARRPWVVRAGDDG